MSPVNNLINTAKAIRINRDIISIIRRANSLSFSNIITNLTYIYILAIVTKHSENGIYIFSLLFPIQYLVTSFNSSLIKVCLQFIANENTSISTGILCTIYIMLAGVVLVIFLASYACLKQIHNVIGANTFLKFVCLYVASDFLKNIVTTTSTIISARKASILYLHSTIFCIASIIATHYFSNICSCGIYSYPIAIFTSTFLSILLLFYKSYNKIVTGTQKQKRIFSILSMLKQTILGIKRHFIVSLGILASSYLSSRLGKESLASFNLVMRIRYIYSIPAISLGTASAIACLPLMGFKNNNLKRICKSSVITLLCYYILIGTLLHLLQNMILGFFISDSRLLTCATYYYLVCLYNIIGFGIYSMYVDFFDTTSHKKDAEYIVTIQLLSQTIIWWGLNQFSCVLNNYLYAVITSYSITLLYIGIKVYKFIEQREQNMGPLAYKSVNSNLSH